MKNELIENVKILTQENDAFNAYNKGKAIVDFLDLEENQELLSKNNLIAIYGEWGSGKSSLMKTIESSLNKEKFKTIWYDTWKYETDDNIPYSLLKYILKNDNWEKFKEKGEKFLDNIYNLFKGFNKGLEFNLGIVTWKPGETLETIQQDQNKALEQTVWEKSKEFERVFSHITFNEKKLIVFLDDLDRCESQNIISIISSVKLLLSINKNIIFIMGIDKNAVAKALSNKYNSDKIKAEEYLEKIFPINFNVHPKIENDNFYNWLKKILEISDEEVNSIYNFFEKIELKNPRHIKKILRKYLSIKSFLISKEINVKDKNVLIMIFYFIILNYFYYDEYICINKTKKENCYKNFTLISSNRKTGEKKEHLFIKYNLDCTVNIDETTSYDIFPILLLLSSKYYKKDQLPAFIISPNASIQLSDWLALFEDNICSRFLSFLLESIEDNKLFQIENNCIQIQEVEKLYQIIDDIM